MYRLISFTLLLLLVVSCKHPQPTGSWAATRKRQKNALMATFPRVSVEDALLTYPDVDEALIRSSWPVTLNEAVARFLERTSSADKRVLKETRREDLFSFHYGSSNGILQDFGLWRGNSSLITNCHTGSPDDAARVIVEGVWLKLQTP